MSKERTKISDRLPPHDLEAEQGVMGSILLDPGFALPVCIEKLKAGSECFYDLRHQLIYDTFLELYDAGTPIDVLTLRAALAANNQLEQAGGLNYIQTLPDFTPSAFNVTYYLDEVVESHMLRRAIQAGTEIISACYGREDGEDAVELLGKAQSKLSALCNLATNVEQKSAKNLAVKALDQIEAWHQSKGEPDGLETGIFDFDRMTGGLHPGEVIIIAARPSVGKTSLAMQIAERVAVDNSIPVGVQSLEMTGQSLMLRLLLSRARLKGDAVRGGFLNEGDFARLANAAAKIGNSPLYIDDESGLSILQLKARVRQQHKKNKIKLLVVDYLQLLHSTNRRADNRQQEISDISKGLKELAKELAIPVVVLSQLNRDVEREKGRKPRMSDLRESGSLEQDADIIGLLYRKEDREDSDGAGLDTSPDVDEIGWVIAKHRNGRTGEIPLIFHKSYTRFEVAAKEMPDMK